MATKYYLAKMTGLMAIALLDGQHAEPEGVAQAAKLYRRIFNEDTSGYVMVAVDDVPDINVPIDEEAADICARSVATYRSRRGAPPETTGRSE